MPGLCQYSQNCEAFYAWDHWDLGFGKGQTPNSNSILVFNSWAGNIYGHVAVVTNVNGNILSVNESNWHGDELVDCNVTYTFYPSESKVKRANGATKYPVLGFIYGSDPGTNNSEPVYISGNVTPDQGSSGGNFYFETKWEDADNDYIVDVKVRYRRQGASTWNEVLLDYIGGGSQPEFSNNVQIDGPSGTYEYQFNASDANPADGPRMHTTDWQGGGTFEIVGGSSGYASVSEGIAIQPSQVVLGEDFTINFTLKEINDISKTFENVAIAILRADNSLVFDLAMYSNVTIPANGTWSKSPTGILYVTNPPGYYKAVIRGKVGGQWFDFDTTDNGVNHKTFTAVANSSQSVDITHNGLNIVDEQSAAFEKG